MENIKMYTEGTKLETLNIDGIECYELDGVAYLKLEAVARGLGFTRVANSGNEVVRWERVNKYLAEFGVPTCGHDDFIPENIFYRLAMKANNAAAEAFQKKIADEVIPSIRKHGAYLTPEKVEEVLLNPDTIILLATRLKNEQEERMRLEAQIEADAPKVELAEQCLMASNSISLNEFCKVLYRENDLEIGSHRLFRFLREHKVLQANNLPYQSYMQRGWFDNIQEQDCVDSNIITYPTARITPKGQMGVLRLLKKYYKPAM
jgi:anti-repressor protein